MTTPPPPLNKAEDKCPKCGEITYRGWFSHSLFKCGTRIMANGNVIWLGSVCQLRSLISTQAERIKELEEGLRLALIQGHYYLEGSWVEKGGLKLLNVSSVQELIEQFSTALLQPKGEKSE
jgi:hypothetical protein